MRFFEVIAFGSYNLFVIEGMYSISIIHYWNHFKKSHEDQKHLARQCFVDSDKLAQMTGTTVSFIEIEILVYFSFILTIVILIFKSNFKNIGIDNTD